MPKKIRSFCAFTFLQLPSSSISLIFSFPLQVHFLWTVGFKDLRLKLCNKDYFTISSFSSVFLMQIFAAASKCSIWAEAWTLLKWIMFINESTSFGLVETKIKDLPCASFQFNGCCNRPWAFTSLKLLHKPSIQKMTVLAIAITLQLIVYFCATHMCSYWMRRMLIKH